MKSCLFGVCISAVTQMISSGVVLSVNNLDKQLCFAKAWKVSKTIQQNIP